MYVTGSISYPQLGRARQSCKLTNIILSYFSENSISSDESVDAKKCHVDGGMCVVSRVPCHLPRGKPTWARQKWGGRGRTGRNSIFISEELKPQFSPPSLSLSTESGCLDGREGFWMFQLTLGFTCKPLYPALFAQHCYLFIRYIGNNF